MSIAASRPENEEWPEPPGGQYTMRARRSVEWRLFTRTPASSLPIHTDSHAKVCDLLSTCLTEKCNPVLSSMLPRITHQESKTFFKFLFANTWKFSIDFFPVLFNK